MYLFRSLAILILLLVSLLSLCLTTQAAPVPFLMNTTDPALMQEALILQEISRFNPGLSDTSKNKICQSILKECQVNKLDPLLVTGLIAAESSFRPSIVSPCAARGLMQISKVVSKMMKINDPFDIRQNIYAGTRYLKQLQNRFQSRDLVLAAYNAGPTRVARLGRIPHIRETINYVYKISLHHAKLKSTWSKSLACSLENTSKIQFSPPRSLPTTPTEVPINLALIVSCVSLPKPTV